jgi:EmrB/QacA subfamily drug resistance transporter
VNVALPSIRDDLGFSQTSLAWVVNAYLLTFGGFLLLGGRLGDLFGHRRLFLIGILVFTAASVVCGISTTQGLLVGARAVQGFGGAIVSAVALSLIMMLFTEAGERAKAMGVFGFVMAGGGSIGVLAGGVLTDVLSWHWVFLVNLPIGIAALAIVASVLPASVGRREGRGAPIDLAGIALLTASVGLVLVGLSQRTHAGADGALPAWTELRTGGLIAAGLLLLAAFVRVERRAASPVVPLSLFADRRTAAILAAGATGAFGLFAGVFLLPRYFQGVEHVSATHSGLLIYPLLIGLVVSVNLVAAVIIRRGEFRGPILAGLAILALGALGFATFDASTPQWESLVFMGLIGLGVGPMLSGLQIAMQRTVAPQAIGGAMGTLLLLRQVGASVALAASETVYASGGNAATGTGTGVFALGLAGAALAAVALLTLPRPATRFAVAPATA